MRLAGPVSLDIRNPTAGLSGSGAAGIAYTVQDSDAPATQSAYAVWRRAGGGLSSASAVPGSKQVLASSFQGGTLQLLTGSAASTDSCCSSAGVIGMAAGGRFGKLHTLVTGLGGTTVGDMVTLGRRTLAAVGTERGLWVSQSNTSGSFAKAHQIAGGRSAPASLAATAISGGTAVAWGGGKQSAVGPRSVYLATGKTKEAPRRASAALTVPGTDGIDQVGVAGGKGGATLAWIDSYYDHRGNYRSGVRAADAAHMKKVTNLQLPGVMASGLAFAGDARGDEVLAWKTCSWSGSCSVQASVRAAGKAFGRPGRLGSIDAGEVPALAVAPGGQTLVSWISGGHVLGSYLSPHSTRFGKAVTVSSTVYAADVTVAFRSNGQAIAVWSQNTLAPEIVGALFSPR
ncbi:MAG TPA: hypothetical protein VGI87_03260 [Solirubrobacteraceae bacterium]